MTDLDLILREEREFVQTLGGHSLVLHGGTLVVHERIPAPRFNFVQEVNVRRDRSAAFFEQALDHYFQRALRPSIRVRVPAADHLLSTLRQLGFQARPNPLVFLANDLKAVEGARASPEFVVGPASQDELPSVVASLADEKESIELTRLLQTAWLRPGADEAVVPLLARKGSEIVGGALLHRFRSMLGIHGVSTQPAARGQGVATAVVGRALDSEFGGPPVTRWVSTEYPPLESRLAPLGFRPLARFAVFDLPASAQLSLPDAGPGGPPRWRPPRSAPAT